MNNVTKGAIAGLLVVTTGPIGLIAIGIYYLRKQHEQSLKQTELLRKVTITPSPEKNQ